MDGFDLAAERGRRGLNQQEVADEAGMSRVKLSGIEQMAGQLDESITEPVLAAIRRLAPKPGDPVEAAAESAA